MALAKNTGGLQVITEQIPAIQLSYYDQTDESNGFIDAYTLANQGLEPIAPLIFRDAYFSNMAINSISQMYPSCLVRGRVLSYLPGSVITFEAAVYRQIEMYILDFFKNQPFFGEWYDLGIALCSKGQPFQEQLKALRYFADLTLERGINFLAALGAKRPEDVAKARRQIIDYEVMQMHYRFPPSEKVICFSTIPISGKGCNRCDMRRIILEPIWILQELSMQQPFQRQNWSQTIDKSFRSHPHFCNCIICLAFVEHVVHLTAYILEDPRFHACTPLDSLLID